MFFAGARLSQGAVFGLLCVQFLNAEVTVRGRVVDEASAAVPSAVISVRPKGQPASSGLAIEVTADPTGAFQMSLSQPRAYLFTVSQTDFFRLIDHNVEFSDGPNEIVLTLNHIR